MKNGVRHRNSAAAGPSLLILSCSGGAGHHRAAEALHRTAAQLPVPLRTEHHDVLEFTTPLFRRLYAGSYLSMANSTPELWGYLYQRSERTPYRKQGLIRLFDRLMYRRYLSELTARRPDALVCTHFLPYLSIADDLRTLHIPVFAVTTDFDVHQLWVNPVVERYSVFHEESAWQLASKGVPRERIAVHGIPVMPEFGTNAGAASSRADLGIPRSAFTILILSGGFGIGRIDSVVRQVLTGLEPLHRRRFTVLAVCGRNEQARTSVASITPPSHVELRTYGFVDTVHTFMAAADLLITKSGGLTSSEALARGLPMLIIDPIPGQESRNADLLVEHGAGWKAVNLANLIYKLSGLLRHPDRLQRARRAARELARPHAAADILKDIVHSLDHRRKPS